MTVALVHAAVRPDDVYEYLSRVPIAAEWG